MRTTFFLRRPWPGLVVAAACLGTLALPSPPGPANAQRARVDGRSVTIVEHARGRFIGPSPGRWVEINPEGRRIEFAEEARDADSVTISGMTGNPRLVLDLRRRQVLVAENDRPQRVLYQITRFADERVRAPSTAEACTAAFQSRVPWNRQGNTQWRPEILERLCRNTTQTASTIECITSEIRAHDNLQRAIGACTNHRHELQVVYIVPRGVQPAPNAEAALGAIMATVQEHYFRQLGVTFRLRTPLVTVVHHDMTVQDLAAIIGLNRGRITADLIAGRFRADFEYRENVIVFVIEGVNAPTATGGASIVVMPSNFWQPVYQHFTRSPSDLHRARLMHGWSHELGHAFGLSHTADTTRHCLARFGVDMGPLPSLIMQMTEVRPSLFDYPFAPEENRLLLEEGYYPVCRSLLGNRPHPVNHLVHVLQRDVTGLDVGRVRFRTGALRVSAPGRWVEEDAAGQARFAFVEQHRDAFGVFLVDRGRNMRLEINVSTRQIMVSQDGGPFGVLAEATEVAR